MNRQTFLRTGLLTTGMGLMMPTSIAQATDDPLFEQEEIYALVLAAHKDFDATKKILDEKPLLINCTNQSKRGDFETALGGASHMGRKDIADLLIERGARWDIFSLTFMGHTDFVKQYIQLSPQYLHAYGPHGFTLLHHAVVGKHEAFADWLREQGLGETHKKGIFK